jgi:serine/threonine protein phosphatase PrpC
MVRSLMANSIWRVAHASVRGLAHENKNTECQDSFACATIETAVGEILIAVVADGAGSTEKGRTGAETACATFVRQASEFLKTGSAQIASLGENFGKLWIEYFQKEVAEIARRDGKETREYASTLVAAVVADGGAAFYQIGDGAIIFSAKGENENYRFGIEPTETLYVNMTDFLTDATAAEKIRFAFFDEAVEDLILFSDGIFPVAVDYQTNQPHAPFLRPMLAPLKNSAATDGLNEKLEKFLAAPKINEKSDDDKTIILASRSKAEAKVSANARNGD